MKAQRQELVDPEREMATEEAALERAFISAGMRGFNYNSASKASLQQCITRQRDRALRILDIYDSMLIAVEKIDAS